MGNATSLFNLMRNIGGSVGIAVTATMLSRQSVAYRQVLGEHLTPLSVGTQTAYGQMVAAMQAAGTDVTTASSRAILAMNGLLMRQATMVSSGGGLF